MGYQGLFRHYLLQGILALRQKILMLQEVEVLHLVSDHPNIALLNGAFEDKSHVHLVLEVCNGGELFDRIVSKGNLSERQAAEYFRTMVQVAAHCHQLGTTPVVTISPSVTVATLE